MTVLLWLGAWCAVSVGFVPVWARFCRAVGMGEASPPPAPVVTRIPYGEGVQ